MNLNGFIHLIPYILFVRANIQKTTHISLHLWNRINTIG